MDEFIQKLFASAATAGLETAEAFVVENESFEAVYTNGEVTEYSSNQTRGLGFRAMLNKRMGYSATEAFDDAAVSQLVQGALDSASLCEDEDVPFIHKGGDTLPGMNLYLPDLERVTPQEKLDLALQLERAAEAYDDRITKTGYYAICTQKQNVRIVNTYGMDRQYTNNGCRAYLSAIAKDGDSTAVGEKLAVEKDFARLNAAALGAEAAKITLERLHAKSVPSGSYHVIFDRLAMISILSVFASVFSAENAQKGLSLLKGKLNEQIASHAVTIIDDPLMADGSASRPFDAEGVASRRHMVVEEGKFITFLHNLKTAFKDGAENTGNASKAGYAAPVRVSPSNFYIQPGEYTLEALMKNAENGIVITEVTGLHAGANPISGDFSLLSKGYLFVEGTRGTPVEQITVAGNFFEVLRAIQAVGNDLHFLAEGIGSPSVDAGTLSIAGE